MTLLSTVSFALLLVLSVEVFIYYTHANTYYSKRPRTPLWRAFGFFFLAAGSVSLSTVLFSIEGYTGNVWFFEAGRWMELIMCIIAGLSIIHLVRSVKKEVEDD